MPGTVSCLRSLPHEYQEKNAIVFSNGFFLYFPDLKYAGAVVEKIIQKSQKTIAILDIPNMAQQEISEKFQHESLFPGKYEERSRGLDPLYSPRSWFNDFRMNLVLTSACLIGISLITGTAGSGSTWL